MRALVIRQFGEPRQLKIEELATPEPREDQVVVAVHAALINPSDVKNVAGTMHGTSLPRIPGRDFAGTVAKGPEEFIGREVWGTGGDLGFTRDGTHAEFVLIPRAAISSKPSALSMEAAGAAGVTFVTAWTAMVTVSGVKAGETAAIVGAGGGVGSAALQIAKAKGSRVIGIVRSEEDAGLVERLGADHVINSKATNTVNAVREFTDNRGADITFDTSGLLLEETVQMAAMDGRIPVITAPKDGMITFNLRSLYRKSLRVQGLDTLRLQAVDCAALLQQMTPFFQSGQFSVPAVESRPLADAIDAYTQASHGGRRIVLRPNL
jgi:NADPH:quinone reductase